MVLLTPQFVIIVKIDGNARQCEKKIRSCFMFEFLERLPLCLQYGDPEVAEAVQVRRFVGLPAFSDSSRRDMLRYNFIGAGSVRHLKAAFPDLIYLLINLKGTALGRGRIAIESCAEYIFHFFEIFRNFLNRSSYFHFIFSYFHFFLKAFF